MHNAPRAELGKKMNTSGSTRPATQTRQPVDMASEISDEETPELPIEPNARDPPTSHQAASPPQTHSAMDAASLRVMLAESNDRLTNIADTLGGVKQVLIRTQQNYAQGTRSFYHLKGASLTADLETMNDEGQFPTAQGLPLLSRDSYGSPMPSNLSNENLARYLQFYNLGGDLVHLGDTLTIRDNERSHAMQRLSDYMINRIRPS